MLGLVDRQNKGAGDGRLPGLLLEPYPCRIIRLGDLKVYFVEPSARKIDHPDPKTHRFKKVSADPSE